MRSRWAWALTAALVITVGGAASGASATDPVTLGDTRVVDESGALTASEESAVDAHLTEVSESAGVDLWVVYVPTFTNPSNSQEWADAVAIGNGLGVNQYLLAIATDSRQYYLSGDQEGPVTWEQLATIEQESIQPALAAGDWAGGATAAADGLASAAGGGSGAPDSGSGGMTPFVIFLVLAAVAGLVIWLIVRARRKAKPPVAGGAAVDQVAALPLEELSRRASSALVQTDDAIKTSEQELGFARAQFGDETAREFDAALVHAKQDLDMAFALKQQLDDEVTDSEADIRRWTTEILELCDHANTELDAKADAFDALRQLEQNAPEALARTQQLRGTVGEESAAAASRLASLTQTYAPEALATVAENPAQAEQRLAFADERLAAAQQAIGAGQGSVAAVEIRAAEDAVAQAKLLQDAVGTLGDALVEAEKDAAAVAADLEKDIATASGVPDPEGRIAPVIASTRQQLEAAKALLSGPGTRPLFALQTLEKANAEIDALLDGVRDAQEKAQRATQQLAQLMTQAQAQVSAAEDFITSRRGAVGAEARTRLAEAGAALVQARQLQVSDPAQALAYAQRANDFAAQASQLAQNDVGAFSGGGGMFGGGGNSGGGGNMMGAVLGGIVINSLLGGGGGGSSRGGGGMFGGGGGGSFGGGGGLGPGSFGGGGTRGRRGGGRF